MSAGREMSGMEKAAVVLLSLDTDTAAKVFQSLEEEQVEEIIVSISKMKDVSPDMQRSALESCRNALGDGADVGGLAKAKSILERALGEERTDGIFTRVGATVGEPGKSAFALLKCMDVKQVVGFLQNEHPQTVAVILSYLEADYSAKLLSALSDDLQETVAERLASMDRTSPEVIAAITAEIDRRFSSNATQRMHKTGGVQAVADILNNVDAETEKRILGSLDQKTPELSGEIRKRMFVFEDLARIDKNSMQRVMKDVDTSDITLSLKVSSDEVKEAIFAGVSKRAREMILEELEYLGPVRLKDVEDAQQRVIEVVRTLEQNGDIIIPGRGRAGDQIVE